MIFSVLVIVMEIVVKVVLDNVLYILVTLRVLQDQIVDHNAVLVLVVDLAGLKPNVQVHVLENVMLEIVVLLTVLVGVVE